MSTNPLATQAQRRIEDRALALLDRDDMKRVRATVTLLWKNVADWPARDQADRFANMIDEYMFHHAFRAANGDANHPEVARFMAPPHRWFGRELSWFDIAEWLTSFGWVQIALLAIGLVIVRHILIQLSEPDRNPDFGR